MTDGPAEPSKFPPWARNALIALVVGAPLAAGIVWGGKWALTHMPAAHEQQTLKEKELERAKAETRKLFPEAAKVDTGSGPSDEDSKLTVFLAQNGPAVGRAPDASFAPIIEKRLKMLKALKAHDVQACGHAALTWDIDSVAEPAAYRLSTDAGIAALQAVRAGLDHPVERGPRTPEDRAVLNRALEAGGVAEPLRALIMRPSGMTSALPQDRCDAVITLYETLLKLPPDVRARTFLAIWAYG